MSMNSGQEASPDRPTAEATDAAEDAETVDSADTAETVDPGDASDGVDPADADAAVDPESEALQRSQDAIDEGREAAREALQDNPPDADPSAPGAPES